MELLTKLVELATQVVALAAAVLALMSARKEFRKKTKGRKRRKKR